MDVLNLQSNDKSFDTKYGFVSVQNISISQYIQGCYYIYTANNNLCITLWYVAQFVDKISVRISH